MRISLFFKRFVIEDLNLFFLIKWNKYGFIRKPNRNKQTNTYRLQRNKKIKKIYTD